MNRRKVLTYLLGASFIAGLTSKKLQSKKGDTPPKKKHVLAPFVGEWIFVEPTHSYAKNLVLDEEARLFIGGKLLQGSITSVQPTHFVYTDHYGYELTFQMKTNTEMLLYDSADEKEYRLVLHSPNKAQ